MPKLKKNFGRPVTAEDIAAVDVASARVRGIGAEVVPAPRLSDNGFRKIEEVDLRRKFAEVCVELDTLSSWLRDYVEATR